MKVYLISSGNYSDYTIERIFLNKEKAEMYVKYSSNCQGVRIEEFNTDDDKIIIPLKYLRIEYWFEKSVLNDCEHHKIGDFEFSIEYNNSLDSINDNGHTYYDNLYGKLIVLRNISFDSNGENEQPKLKKIAEDIIAQIKYNQSEGWKYNQIQSWLYDFDNDKESIT